MTTNFPDGHPAVASRRGTVIAAFAITAIVLRLLLRLPFAAGVRVPGISARDTPLFAALFFGGIPLLVGLGRRVLRGEFGSDLLAGISIITSVMLGEYLAGTHS